MKNRVAARAWRRTPSWLRVFVFLLPLMFAQRILELTSFEKTIESLAYRVLQARLHADASKIVIVDISDLQAVDVNGVPQKDARQQDLMTPRAALDDLAMALTDACAKAIAFDIDFSPDRNVFIGQEDPQFFKRWSELGIPVFLGVARAAGGPPESWLGNPDFARMAAGIVVPHATGSVAENGMPGPYPVYIPRLEPPGKNDASRGDDNLPTLAVALATAADGNLKRTLLGADSPLDAFTKTIADRPFGEGPNIPEFAVNYSSLDQLETTRILAKWDTNGRLAATNDWSSVADKLVLIGDVKGASADDTFHVANGQIASGVVHHAMATATLLSEPLRVFKPAARVVVDIVCITLVMAIVLPLKRKPPRWIRRRFHISTNKRNYLWWPAAKCLVILVLTAFGAWLVLRWGHVLWIDGFAVAAAGVLHAALDEPMETAIDKGMKHQAAHT